MFVASVGCQGNKTPHGGVSEEVALQRFEQTNHREGEERDMTIARVGRGGTLEREEGEGHWRGGRGRDAGAGEGEGRWNKGWEGRWSKGGGGTLELSRGGMLE